MAKISKPTRREKSAGPDAAWRPATPVRLLVAGRDGLNGVPGEALSGIGYQ